MPGRQAVARAVGLLDGGEAPLVAGPCPVTMQLRQSVLLVQVDL